MRQTLRQWLEQAARDGRTVSIYGGMVGTSPRAALGALSSALLDREADVVDARELRAPYGEGVAIARVGSFTACYYYPLSERDAEPGS